MKHRVRVVCGPAIAGGFRLAGVAAAEAADTMDGARRLATLLADADAGVILVQEDIHAALPEPDRRALARRTLPLVVPFPMPQWGAPAERPEAFVSELLRQAIGYRVRLG